MILPGTLFKALAPRAAAAVSLRLVSAALNHLLAQHPNARRRLAAHQSKRVCIGLDAAVPEPVTSLVPLPELWFVIDSDGALRTAQAGYADAKLLIKPSLQAAIDMASAGTSEANRHLRVEGDVLLAGLLGELIQGLRWDFEDDLSRVVGDIPARRVGQAIQRVGDLGQQLGRRAVAAATGVNDRVNVRQGPGVEEPVDGDTTAPLLARSIFDAWRDDVDELMRRVETLEAKATRK